MPIAYVSDTEELACNSIREFMSSASLGGRLDARADRGVLMLFLGETNSEVASIFRDILEPLLSGNSNDDLGIIGDRISDHLAFSVSHSIDYTAVLQSAVIGERSFLGEFPNAALSRIEAIINSPITSYVSLRHSSIPPRPASPTTGQTTRRSNNSMIRDYTIWASSDSSTGRDQAVSSDRGSMLDQLRPRPREDGINSLGHNLNTSYGHCIGKYKDKYVYIHSFTGDNAPKAVIHDITDNGIEEKGRVVPYQESHFDLAPPELGWVEDTQSNLFFLSRGAGGDGRYLRTISKRNTAVVMLIYPNGDAREYTSFSHALSLIKRVFEPKRFSFSEGLDRKLDSWVYSPHVAIHRPKGTTGLRSVYFNEIKIGTLSDKYRFIKVDKKYNSIIPFFKKAVDGYEIR
jgi:hypothetical protein